MKKKILKYSLVDNSGDEPKFVKELQLPVGAEILSVQSQGDIPQVWAIVDPEAETETRQIEIFATGEAIETENVNRKYLGTIQLKGGAFVFHAFERIS